MWFGTKKQLACLRTVTAHIQNMITVRTRGPGPDHTLRSPRLDPCLQATADATSRPSPATSPPPATHTHARTPPPYTPRTNLTPHPTTRAEQGVRLGFKYKMRFVYSHFPINCTVAKAADGDAVEIRNFMGEKRVRKILLPSCVTATRSADVKDELVIEVSAWARERVGAWAHSTGASGRRVRRVGEAGVRVSQRRL